MKYLPPLDVFCYDFSEECQQQTLCAAQAAQITLVALAALVALQGRSPALRSLALFCAQESGAVRLPHLLPGVSMRALLTIFLRPLPACLLRLPLRFALAAGLAVCLLLLLGAPRPGQAVIYTDKKDNTLFLTNDKRKMRETPPINKEKQQPGEKAPKAAAKATSPEDMQLSRLAFQLESGLRKGRPERIVELFHFFPEQVSPQALYQHRESAEAFFQLFFKTFGTTRGLEEGSSSQEKLHLARIYSATKKEIDSADCDWKSQNYLAPLQSKKGAVSIHVSYCEPRDGSGKNWIKDMGVALVAPDEAFKEQGEAFKERYSQEMNTIAQNWRKSQEALEKQQAQKAKKQADAAQEKQAPSAAPKQMQQQQAAQQKPAPQPPATGQGLPPANMPQTNMPQNMPQSGMPQLDMPQLDIPGGGMDPMMLLGFLSGTFITLFLAVSIFFYLLYSASIYVIARKLDVNLPWLAWIPIAQMHPLVLSAGMPPWVTAAIIGSFILSAIPLVGAFVSLAVLVIFIYIWIKITERLGNNKWLGLLVLLPLVQFIYPAWLAFKNDALRSRVDVKNVLTKSLLMLLLLSALSWAVTTYVITPMLKPFMDTMSALQLGGQTQPQGLPQQMPQKQPQNQPETQPQAQPQAHPSTNQSAQPQQAGESEQGPGFQVLDKQAYEQLLSSAQAPTDGASSGPHVRLGPALVRYDTFWADEQRPHFWLKVILPQIPNISLGNSGNMVIEKVLDSSGTDVYDSENSFEEGRFTQLSFHAMQWQTPRLEAIRDVHLKAGAVESDMGSVSGALQLRLPLNIQVLEFTASDSEATKEMHGFTVTLQAIENNEARLVFSGDEAKHVATVAYDAQGNKLDQQFSSWNSTGGSTRISYGYSGPPQRLDILVASGILEKNYPFTLELQ